MLSIYREIRKYGANLYTPEPRQPRRELRALVEAAEVNQSRGDNAALGESDD